MGEPAPSPAGRDSHIVLVGLMGSGKSTIGSRLATILRRPFVDSDEVIEARTGRTVREIWREDGEAAFRVLESEALAEALASPMPSVVAAAGGTVLSPANRDLIRTAGHVVWLRADVGELVTRAEHGDHRPLLDADPRGTLQRMAVDREPLYREVATDVVEVGDVTPDVVVERVVEAVR